MASVLYVYREPANGDRFYGVPNRDITDTEWAAFTLTQKRIVKEAASAGTNVWVHIDLADETEAERIAREAAEAAARQAQVRAARFIQGYQFDVEHDPATGALRNVARPAEVAALTPGAGQVMVGGTSGPQAVARYKVLPRNHAALAMGRNLAKLLANHYFADDFERPDTTGSTSTSNTGLGNGWQITGSGYLTGRINNGAYINSGNTYVWRQLPFTPVRQSVLASWSGSTRAIVIIQSPDSGLFANAVHTFFSPTQVLIQIRVGNVGTTLATIPLSLATDSTQYELAHEVLGTTIVIYVDGVEVGRATDARVSSLVGTYATYQIAGNASEPTTPRIEFVDATGAALA